MAIRQIRIWPDPALSEVAQKVESFDEDLETLVTDMFETMYEANGVGLAATQIAIPTRVLIIDLDPNGDAPDDPDLQAELDSLGFKGPQEFINPEILSSDGNIVWEEGCLSIPGYTEKVKRKRNVTVKAFDRHGQEFQLEATGLYSVALQHEIDHLDGKVFVDYLSRLKRDVVKRKMNRLKMNGTSDGVVAAANL